MDIKTLEYMGTRVDKARSLQEEIAAVKKSITEIKNYENFIIFFTDSCPAFGKGRGAMSCSKAKKIFAPAIIEIAEKYVAELEEEFAKL